jgi:hypothetical protein
MKSLFEESAKREILNRIDSISPQATRLWGTMEVSQMLCHCNRALEMANGTLNPKRVFIGRVLGPLFKGNYSNEKPFGQGSPTSGELMVRDLPQFENERQRLKELVTKFSGDGESKVTTHPHPFFGPLTPGEWGKGMYKHLDHHLRQFGY